MGHETAVHEIDVLTSLAEVGAIADEWTELARHNDVGPLMLAPVAIAWLRHVCKGQPHVMTARRRDGTLMGILPLHKRRLGPGHVLRWVGHGMGPTGDALVHPRASDPDAVVDEMLAVLARERTPLQLVDVARSSRFFRRLTRSPDLHYAADAHDTVPLIDLAGVSSVEEFLSGAGRRKLRQNMARLDRAMAANAGHAVTTSVVTSPDAIAAALPGLTAVHDRSEARQPRQHFLRGVNRAFTIEAMDRAAESDQVAVVTVASDGEPVAFLISFISGRTLAAWVARIDPAALELAPGHQMLRAAVQWAIEHRLRCIDLQLGADAYKLRWSSRTEETVAVVAARHGILAPIQTSVRLVERVYAWRVDHTA